MSNKTILLGITYDIKCYLMGLNSSISFTEKEWTLIYQKLCEAIKNE